MGDERRRIMGLNEIIQGEKTLFTSGIHGAFDWREAMPIGGPKIVQSDEIDKNAPEGANACRISYGSDKVEVSGLTFYAVQYYKIPERHL